MWQESVGVSGSDSTSTRIDCDVAGWNAAASGRRAGLLSAMERGGEGGGCMAVVTSGAGSGGPLWLVLGDVGQSHPLFSGY